MTAPIRHLLTAAGCVAVLSGTATAQPGRLSGASCDAALRLNCPEANCPAQLTGAEGNALEPKTGRRFFIDYPCDLKSGEEVVFVLNLHGAGSIGNWQRHYFPAVDYAGKYRLVIATPTAAGSGEIQAGQRSVRMWIPSGDDEYLRNVVDFVIVAFVIFLMVKGINALRRKSGPGQDPAAQRRDRQEGLHDAPV